MTRSVVALLIVGCAAARPDAAATSIAVWRGDLATVHDHLARGADVDSEAINGITAWMWALVARDRPMLELLFAHLPRVADRESSRIALRIAAAVDDRWLVRALLARGVPVDAPVDTRASPLMVAAANALPEMTELLLDAGASPAFRDSEGDTAVDVAQRAGCTACVAALIAHGATSPPPVPPPAREPPSAEVAIARAIPLLQHAADRWQRDGECLACHHHAMVLRVTALAETRGIALDRELARSAAAAVRDDDDKYASQIRPALGSADLLVRATMETGGDVAFGNGWFLAAELAAHLPRTPSQETLAAFLAQIQQPDGRWRMGPYRGVIEASEIVSTALVVEAIAGYGTADAKRALPAAARWLASARPATTIDHAFRLRGLAAIGGDPAPEIAELRQLQHDDGSWSHTPGPGDAYSTGLVAVALVEAGRVDPHDPALARAAQYLLRTQEPDGSWRVPSRAPPILPYHDHGFPGGKLQFVSFAATAWATLALIYSATSSRT